MIGFLRLKTDNYDYSIDDFFKELPEVKIDIKISFCGDLDEYVFGTFKEEDAPKDYYYQVNSIFLSKNEINIISYNELTLFFKDKYLNKIKNKLYSKNYYSKIWSDLTEEDISFLKNID